MEAGEVFGVILARAAGRNDVVEGFVKPQHGDTIESKTGIEVNHRSLKAVDETRFSKVKFEVWGTISVSGNNGHFGGCKRAGKQVNSVDTETVVYVVSGNESTIDLWGTDRRRTYPLIMDCASNIRWEENITVRIASTFVMSHTVTHNKSRSVEVVGENGTREVRKIRGQFAMEEHIADRVDVAIEGMHQLIVGDRKDGTVVVRDIAHQLEAGNSIVDLDTHGKKVGLPLRFNSGIKAKNVIT